MDKLNKIRSGDKVLEKDTHVIFPELYENLLLPYQRERETISHFFARYCRFTEKYPIFWSNFINPERAKAHLFILQLRRIWRRSAKLPPALFDKVATIFRTILERSRGCLSPRLYRRFLSYLICP